MGLRHPVEILQTTHYSTLVQTNFSLLQSFRDQSLGSLKSEFSKVGLSLRFLWVCVGGGGGAFQR